MPELPEVEAARRAIEENCLGKTIKKSIIASDPKVIDGVSASDFESSLLGKTIVAAHRKGKNLWLQLDSPPFPSFQFGMAGAVYIKGVAVTKYKRSAVKDNEEWPSKYSKVFIELDDGMELSFTDKRRFAKVRLLKDPTSVPPISELGPDALLELMTIDEFATLLSKKRIAIKALLLDQNFISGIGNWVADEVLYQAKIHPLQVASTLSRESCATLQKCIKEVIEKAIEVGADSSQYPNNWIFHSREKKPGKAFVDGKKIEFITAGGRTTALVPELQKLSGNQPAKASSKQGKQSNRRKGHQGESDNEDADEQETDEDDRAKKTKGRKEVKPKGQAKKKLPAKRKSKESDDDANEPEADEDKIVENTIPKKGLKAKGQVKKKLPAKRTSKGSDDERNDDGTDEEDDDAENTKPKKGAKAKGQAKMVLAKKKSKESDDEENDSGADEDHIAENTKPKKGVKPKGQVKKNLPAKRKSEESDGEENGDGTDDNDDEGDKFQKKKSKKVTDDKQSIAGKTTKKKVQSSQTSKNVKTKSK